MTFSRLSGPYQTSVTLARLRLCHHYCHDRGTNKVKQGLNNKSKTSPSLASCRGKLEIATHSLLLKSVSRAADMVTQLEAWCKSFLKWHFQLTLSCHFGPESAHMRRGHWFADSQRNVLPFVKSSSGCELLTWGVWLARAWSAGR